MRVGVVDGGVSYGKTCASLGAQGRGCKRANDTKSGECESGRGACVARRRGPGGVPRVQPWGGEDGPIPSFASVNSPASQECDNEECWYDPEIYPRSPGTSVQQSRVPKRGGRERERVAYTQRTSAFAPPGP